MNFTKVWWHCLRRTFSSGHRMMRLEYIYFGTFYFCECGYKDFESVLRRRFEEALVKGEIK